MIHPTKLALLVCCRRFFNYIEPLQDRLGITSLSKMMSCLHNDKVCWLFAVSYVTRLSSHALIRDTDSTLPPSLSIIKSCHGSQKSSTQGRLQNTSQLLESAHHSTRDTRHKRPHCLTLCLCAAGCSSATPVTRSTPTVRTTSPSGETHSLQVAAPPCPQSPRKQHWQRWGPRQSV